MQRILLGLAIGLIFARAATAQTTSPSPPTETAPSLPVLSLDEVIRMALANHPDIQIAQANERVAASRTQQARSALQPNFTVSSMARSASGAAGLPPPPPLPPLPPPPPPPPAAVRSAARATPEGPLSSSGPVPAPPLIYPAPPDAPGGLYGGVNMSQMIFDSGRTRNRIRQAVILEESAAVGLTEAQARVVLDTRRAFYALVRAEDLMDIREAGVHKWDQGSPLLAQVGGTMVPTMREEAQEAAEDARCDSMTAQVDLALAMGLDPGTPLRVQPAHEPAIETEDVNSLVTLAEEKRPEIRQAQLAIEVAQKETFEASKLRAPSVGLVATTGTQPALGPVLGVQENPSSVGMILQWPLGDGGLSSARHQEAQAHLDAARWRLQQTRFTVAAEVRKGWLALQAAQHCLAALRLREASAGAGFSNGYGAMALAGFADAHDAVLVDLARQQEAVDIARASLQYATGRWLR